MRKTNYLWSAFAVAALIWAGCGDENPTTPQPQAPQVRITFPGDSARVADTVFVTVTATDDAGIAEVRLFIDTAVVQVWRREPYVYPWNTRTLDNLSWHRLWAEATDTDSLTATSDTISVQVDFSRGVGQDLVLVANYNGGAGTISYIDRLANDRLVRDVIGLGNVPNDILWDGRLLVVNSLSNDLNIVALTYSNSFEDEGTRDLGRSLNRSPQYAAIADGRMFISNFNSDDVTILDLGTLQPVGWLPVGTSPADVVALNGKIYVCNTGFDRTTYEFHPGSLSIIHPPDNRIATLDSIGYNPQFMAVDPLGRLHVVCSGNSFTGVPGEVLIYDPGTDSLVQVVALGGNPGEIVITSDGTAYVAAGGWAPDPGRVFRYDSRTGRILNGPSNPIEVNAGAMRIAASSDGTVWVACYDGDTVDKVVGDRRVASFPAGDGPGALFVLER